MNFLDTKLRPQLIDHLSNQEFDLLVVGGGITGAGIALDAVTRGMKVALVEKNDFAFGTSSRSTKLIHGGLRYLKQFELKLVRDTGRERAVAYRNAPHLVVPEKLLLPFVKGGSLGKHTTSVALWVYDLLAGVKKEDSRVMLDREKTLAREPLLKEDRVLGGGYYAEYRTDDARLVMCIAKTAAHKGALLANYMESMDFIYENGQIVGSRCKDHLSGKTITIKAKNVVNAAGPWVDLERKKDHSLKGKRLQLTKGVHIVFSKEKFPLNQAVYFDVPDGRMMFAIPRGRAVYVGTSDTVYEGDIDKPTTTREDALYLLDGIKHMFDIDLGLEDIESSWAGLRPLIYEEGKAPGELSRKDELFYSSSGLISIAGGKLTGYRLMAKKVVDVVADRLQLKAGCRTKTLTLSGGEFDPPKAVEDYIAAIEKQLSALQISRPSEGAEYLVRVYGKETAAILASLPAQNGRDNDERLILAECEYCLSHEQCFTLLDFFLRRTGRLLYDMPSVDRYADLIRDHMANHLGWDEQEQQRQEEALQEEIRAIAEFLVEA